MDYNSFFVSYEDFKEKLTSIKVLRDAALFATIYAGYARVGEIVRSRKSPNPKIKPIPPLNKDQIEFTDEHMMLSIKTEKTFQWRKVPVGRAKEQWLIDIIQKWLAICDYELFPISTVWAEKLFEKYFGTQHIHLLRHWAATHAFQGKRTREALNYTEVARLGGWRNFNTLYRTYAHYTVDDFKHKI
jgi:integrase